MDASYDKKWANETSSTAILINSPEHIHQGPKAIRHYFVFSLFSAICLCPATGLIALAYSLKSSAKADVNFHEKSRIYSRRALLWNVISVILAIFSLVLTLAFCYQMIETMKKMEAQMSRGQRPNDVDKLIQSMTFSQ